MAVKISAALYSPETFVVLISVRGLVDSQAMALLEGLYIERNPVASQGTESATFLLNSDAAWNMYTDVHSMDWFPCKYPFPVHIISHYGSFSCPPKFYIP
jgi:hypothetical protein